MSTPAQVPPDTKSRSRTLPLLLGLVVVAAGAGGGWFWWQGHATANAEGGPAIEVATLEPGSLLPLQTFTVNLADQGTARYLRTTVQLVLAGKSTAGQVEHDPLALVRARSAALELLTTRTSVELATTDGKTALKADLAREVSQAIGHEVTDVLFTDFVVQ